MRVKALNMFLLACLSVPFFSNCCITTTAYCGARVSSSEMFQISGEKNRVTVKGKNYLEATLLVKIDSQVVGSFQKGWPKVVKAKAGERMIEIRHYKGWDSTCENQPTVEITSGTCTMTPDYYKHYLIKFQADKDKKYKVAFKTKNPQANTEPEVILTEEDSGKRINCKVEPLNQNTLTQR